jgi:hypothetical protein
VVGRIRFALERFGSPRHRSHVAQLFSLGHILAMTDDAGCVLMTGLIFTGLGFIMRKQKKKNWQAFIFGGATMFALALLSIIFGWGL